MTVLVFLDPAFPAGRIADAAVPQLLATDQGATRGDGVFESMLAVGGMPRKLEAHLARLASSASMLDLAVPPAGTWRAAIGTALAEYRSGGTAAGNPETDEAVVKLVATRGPDGAAAPTAWVQVSAAPELGRRQRTTGVGVVLLDRGYDSTVAERAPWLLLGAKTLSYAVNMAALRYARAHGAEDVIFVSSDGKVLEGPTSTVLLAVREDGVKRLLTPQLESGILPGTSQGALFAAAEKAGWKLGYGPLEPRHLTEADAVWLISSIRLLAPVHTVDGQPISTAPDLTAELNALLADIP
jgi:4-amino-4-deoxychorismate lyase